jgi:hypothetical protein
MHYTLPRDGAERHETSAMSTSPGRYLILIDQQQYGPYSPEELHEGLAAGWARPEHLVWGPDLATWTPLGQLPGLGAPIHPPALPTAPARKRPRGRLLSVCLVASGAAAVALVLATVIWLGRAGSPFAGDRQPEPYDFEDIYTSDTGDWRSYPDRPAEEAAIAGRQRELVRALRAGDVEAAAQFVDPEEREIWTSQTRANPALAATLADALDTAELSFLGVEINIPDDPRTRTAAFVVTSGRRSFEVMWIKLDGVWYLYRC